MGINSLNDIEQAEKPPLSEEFYQWLKRSGELDGLKASKADLARFVELFLDFEFLMVNAPDYAKHQFAHLQAVIAGYQDGLKGKVTA